MLKRNLVIGAEAALRNFFGREEVANLLVGCGWWAGLVVAEELPVGDVFKVELSFELAEVRQCGTLP